MFILYSEYYTDEIRLWLAAGPYHVLSLLSESEDVFLMLDVAIADDARGSKK